jgi:hypothetical protein
MTQQPLNVTQPERAPTLALGPTRPDKLTLWPVEGDRYGIDVVYQGEQGWRRANIVHGQLAMACVPSRFLQEVDGSWKVRIGPVGRDEMLTVLNGFVW